MTEAEAVALAATEWWKAKPAREALETQLNEPLLIMPMTELMRVASEALGRDVYTHELAKPQWLLEELRGEREPMNPLESLRAILGPDKPIVVVTARPADETETT